MENTTECCHCTYIILIHKIFSEVIQLYEVGTIKSYLHLVLLGWLTFWSDTDTARKVRAVDKHGPKDQEFMSMVMIQSHRLTGSFKHE